MGYAALTRRASRVAKCKYILHHHRTILGINR
jgi:hypothetical protein